MPLKAFRPTRLSIAVAVVAGVVAIGSAITLMPDSGPRVEATAPPPASPPAPAPTPAPALVEESPADAEFRKLFETGVAYMRAGRAHEAIVVFDNAKRQRPHVAAVSVNLGFAKLSRGDAAGAQVDFERALAIAPGQANAYYGLGAALEAEGDVAGALGAMRAFIHLEKEETPFRRKAEAAIWELEERLKVQRAGTEAPRNAAPGSGQ